jgi:RNA polymerase sigma-70 factor (ECF subfamily)
LVCRLNAVRPAAAPQPVVANDAAVSAPDDAGAVSSAPPPEGSAEHAVGGRRHRRRLIELIAQHRPALLNYVRGILRSSEDAEDVVQETCVRLMRVHDLWRGEREVRAFLFTIATNLARDELRRRRARGHGMHLPFESVELVGEELQPDEIVDRHIAWEAIVNALRSLPPRYREVFRLHVESQMSYRAIAKRLGISTKTVERDMSGAHELCQDRLGRRQGAGVYPYPLQLSGAGR